LVPECCVASGRGAVRQVVGGITVPLCHPAVDASSAIWVLLPHPFSFAFGATALLGQSDHVGGVEVKEGYRAAVLWMDPSITANRDAIERLSNWFSVSCACLALEVVLWTISLA
jgi:hypothetical protein